MSSVIRGGDVVVRVIVVGWRKRKYCFIFISFIFMGLRIRYTIYKKSSLRFYDTHTAIGTWQSIKLLISLFLQETDKLTNSFTLYLSYELLIPHKLGYSCPWYFNMYLLCHVNVPRLFCCQQIKLHQLFHWIFDFIS